MRREEAQSEAGPDGKGSQEHLELDSVASDGFQEGVTGSVVKTRH